jgi:hypothetical protein
MKSFDDAYKDFSTFEHVTYFEPGQHTEIYDLCFLCLHELDLHAEGEYWHPIALRKKLLAFCKKWGYYANEAQQQFDLGKSAKKCDAYI